jgi:phosphatidylglycerophosphate synthase
MDALVEVSSVPGDMRKGGHVRLHRSVLAASEKQLLVWMATRLPAWVSPDQLSALGMLSMVGVGASFWLAGSQPAIWLPMVPVFLVLNWFGDSLDGTLARVRRQERPRFGFYVDHVIDMAGTVCLVAGLAASGFMHVPVALLMLVAFLCVMGESFLATHTRGLFRMSFLGWGPTELRVVIAAGALWMLNGSLVTPFGLGPFQLFDVGGVVASAGLAITFVVNAVRNTIALYHEEPVRK